MSSRTAEVLIFEASDEFRKDPAILIPAFDIALKAGGVHAPAYYGKQVEEPSTRGYVILNWDSFEAHQALIDGPDYSAVIGKLKPSFAADGKIEMYHVQFSAPTIALDTSVTEVLMLTLKAPENRGAVVDILSKISEASEKMLVFGVTREDEKKYILIGGWPNVETHSETVAKPEVAAAFEKLYSLANKERLDHVELSQYRLS